MVRVKREIWYVSSIAIVEQKVDEIFPEGDTNTLQTVNHFSIAIGKPEHESTIRPRQPMDEIFVLVA